MSKDVNKVWYAEDKAGHDLPIFVDQYLDPDDMLWIC